MYSFALTMLEMGIVAPSQNDMELNSFASDINSPFYSSLSDFLITDYERQFKTPYLTVTKILAKIYGGYRPQIPTYIPASIRELISHCWEHQPQDRPSFERISDILNGSIYAEIFGQAKARRQSVSMK